MSSIQDNALAPSISHHARPHQPGRPSHTPRPTPLPPMPVSIEDGANAIMAIIEHERKEAVREYNAKYQSLYASFMEYRVQVDAYVQKMVEAERERAPAAICSLTAPFDDAAQAELETIKRELLDIGLERVGDNQWRVCGEWERWSQEVANTSSSTPTLLDSNAISADGPGGTVGSRSLISMLQKVRLADKNHIGAVEQRCLALESQNNSLTTELKRAQEKMQTLESSRHQYSSVTLSNDERPGSEPGSADEAKARRAGESASDLPMFLEEFAQNLDAALSEGSNPDLVDPLS